MQWLLLRWRFGREESTIHMVCLLTICNAMSIPVTPKAFSGTGVIPASLALRAGFHWLPFAVFPLQFLENTLSINSLLCSGILEACRIDPKET